MALPAITPVEHRPAGGLVAPCPIARGHQLQEESVRDRNDSSSRVQRGRRAAIDESEHTERRRTRLLDLTLGSARRHDRIALDLHDILVADETCLHQRVGGQDVPEALAVSAGDGLPVVHMRHEDARAHDVLETAAE